jgi:hypothetical protein
MVGRGPTTNPNLNWESLNLANMDMDGIAAPFFMEEVQQEN